ncbi:unnamed protein product [Oppiella nova]|uniref:Uncharacterized protein n=1 Tax=Oppiella nova TaxID=334625 RepID=A0A7R9QVD9_9ACAR|nr:unnamed protein product [Oppiella nova]CAG2176458.1 unnamed protein product [Oppiella nova]
MASSEVVIVTRKTCGQVVVYCRSIRFIKAGCRCISKHRSFRHLCPTPQPHTHRHYCHHNSRTIISTSMSTTTSPPPATTPKGYATIAIEGNVGSGKTTFTGHTYRQ